MPCVAVNERTGVLRSQIGQSARLVPVLRDVTVQSVVAPALSSVVKMDDGVWLCATNTIIINC